MSLLAEVRAETTRKGPTCTVPIVLASLSTEDAADLVAAMSDQTITAAAIERVLRRRSVQLAQGTIARHRRGSCLCPAS